MLSAQSMKNNEQLFIDNSWHSFQKTMEGNAFKGTVKEKIFKIAFKTSLILPWVLLKVDSISGHDCNGGVEDLCVWMLNKAMV